ncbi:MAG: metal-transporting ATPase, partial [Lachnospiraceae bacterium]|nr:metal-transporting ATPase [Lachnospiraceae bacterium]
PVSRVRPGDRFAVRAGSSIPVDGTVESGDAAVDESALTGESVPVDKEPGDPVSAGTIRRSGYMVCTASRVGSDTTLSRIIRTVADAQATKAPIARIADKVSAVFVPVVMGLALLTFIGWLVAGQEFGFAIARGISVLVISCPCALGLATPVAIMAGSGVGARNGILYRTAAALEETGRVGIIGLDKTGTVTEGSPRVTDVIPSGSCTEETLVSLAYALEKKSEHPLAKAVNLYAEEHGITAPETEAFRVLPGSGVSGNVLLDGRTVSLAAGNAAFIRKTFPGTALPDETIRSLASAGKTPLLFMLDRAMIGIIAVADTIRDDSKDAVQALDRMGIRVVMLTGDNRFTAEAIAGEAGIRDVVPGVLPDGKSEVVDYLKKAGKTAMVGDGINDAPALTAADVGLAIGAGTDVAIDAADVVLMKSRLSDVPAAVRLSRATLRNIRQNLFWAFFYNALCIPLAMGLFGIALKPMYGAAAMALSSFFVCMNALRLNLLDIHDGSRDRKRKAADADLSGFLKDPETGMAEAPGKDTDYTACGAAGNCGRAERKENMEKTLNIEGMMCMHCEARVKKALENVPGVSAADVSHEKGTAVVTLTEAVDSETLKKAVEDQGYEVKAIA